MERSSGTDGFLPRLVQVMGEGDLRVWLGPEKHRATWWCPNYSQTSTQGGSITEGPAVTQGRAAEMRLSTCHSPLNMQSPRDQLQT